MCKSRCTKNAQMHKKTCFDPVSWEGLPDACQPLKRSSMRASDTWIQVTSLFETSMCKVDLLVHPYTSFLHVSSSRGMQGAKLGEEEETIKGNIRLMYKVLIGALFFFAEQGYSCSNH